MQYRIIYLRIYLLCNGQSRFYAPRKAEPGPAGICSATFFGRKSRRRSRRGRRKDQRFGKRSRAGPACPAEPQRTADLARLDLTRLRIEDGVRLETVFERVTETAADILNVERVGVRLMVDQRRALRCVDLFDRSKKSHSSGVTLQVKDFPEYFSVLERRKTLPAEVALTNPRTFGLTDAYLAPLGITSMLDASIFIGGEVVGVLCHEHTGPLREWTTEERDFAGSMADLMDRIFDPFFTTKPRGRGPGLGLAVAKQIVASAGGFIRVETVDGQGSSFQVYLPRVSS